MRYACWAVFLAASAIGTASSAIGCTGAPREDFDAKPAPGPIDAGGPPSPVATCGDAEDLPARTSRDDAAHAITLACDGDAKALAVTVLDDGVVRLRYGAEGGGSIVALDRPPSTSALRVGRRGSAAVVCTPEVELAIEAGPCTVVARDAATGAVVLEDGAGGGFFRAKATPRGAAAAAGERDVIGVVRASPPGERFYGLGLHTATQPSQARGLDMRGSVVELYNTDAFDVAAGGFRPDAPLLYESIPFYVGLRGKTAYGIFTDNTHRMRFDLASADPAKVRATAWGGAIDQYLVAGPAMRDVVRRYTRLTGRVPMPPPWALGFHQSRWEGPCDGAPPDRPFCSGAQIAQVAQAFRDRGIPADGLFLDIQHMNAFRTFTFDPSLFPDPETLSGELRSLGFQTQTIVDPGIKVDPGWDVYTSGVAGGHFLRAPGNEGSVFEGEVWPGKAAFPDFSAPKTRTWWSDLAGKLAARGVRGLWIDMNEPASFTTGTVPDEVAADGDGRATTMAEVHNAYATFEARATYEGMKAARPTERPFVLSRAAFAGQQKWSAVWTGDAPSTWTTLGMTLPQLLHLGMSGMPFAGSDVGGYSGREESTADLFSRWMALGAVSPFFRAHAEKDARRQEPWAFGVDTLDATRDLVSFRYELMPYLYSLFDESSRTGAPILRPLVFEFQDDEATHAIADEAMLGPSLLVAPVLTREAQTSRTVVLPKAGASRWFDFRSGTVHEGGTTVKVAATPDPLPRDALPVFVREGAIIPRADVGRNVEAARGGALSIDAFPGPSRTTFTLLEDDGTTSTAASRITFATERTATGARFEASARDGTYVAAHARVVVRIRRVDHDPTSVKLGGVALARVTTPAAVPVGSFAWDANDRSVVVALADAFPFTLDLAYDTKLEPDGDVDVPVRVVLPPGTPADTAIHVASSRAAWVHAPLARAGDVATGTMRIPRGAYTSFKVSRGGWPTVEKGEGCAEIDNRRALGAATRVVTATVIAWVDRCP